LLGNLKTSFSGTFHAFNFDKYARHYMGGYCFRFNRRFSMSAESHSEPSTGTTCGRSTTNSTRQDLGLAEIRFAGHKAYRGQCAGMLALGH